MSLQLINYMKKNKPIDFTKMPAVPKQWTETKEQREKRWEGGRKAIEKSLKNNKK